MVVTSIACNLLLEFSPSKEVIRLDLSVSVKCTDDMICIAQLNSAKENRCCHFCSTSL